MSLNLSTKSHRRNTAATLIVAAGAAAFGGLVAAAPANAAPADSYVALSYSLGSKASGMAIAATEEAARISSMRNCAAHGGGCTTYVIAHNSCAALAVGTDPLLHQEYSTATASLVGSARQQALATNGGGVIAVSGCSDNHVFIPPQRPVDVDPVHASDPTPTPPVENDYDHDGLSKHDELFVHHTNPLLADTDFDGVDDGVEITNGTNPRNPLSH